MAIKFDVLNRFTGAVQFTAEIECDADASMSVKLGLAVKWAVKARAKRSRGSRLSGYPSPVQLQRPSHDCPAFSAWVFLLCPSIHRVCRLVMSLLWESPSMWST